MRWLVLLSLLAQTPSPPMKGMELYSWRVEGTWHYALVIGTNRNKTWDEVHRAGVDEAALRQALAGLPKGTEVFFPSLPGSPCEPPPEGIRKLAAAPGR